MYKDEYHHRVKHDLKKLHPRLRESIKTDHISKILAHPEQNEILSEDLCGIYSYHLMFDKQQYRIAYVINEQTETISVLILAKRGEFYRLLKRRIQA